MSTFRLKRKNYSTAVMVGNDILNSANHSANALSNRSQSYYDSLGKEWGNTSTSNLVKEGSKSRVGSFDAKRTLGGKETYKGVNSVASGKQSFQMGQKSVGVRQGMANTWNRMGTMGKAGTVAGAAVVGGLALKGLFGGRKKKD